MFGPYGFCTMSRGERYREWRAVTQEASTHSFSDWPFQGPQSALHVCKHMLRRGGDPKLWMQVWMRRHSLMDSDRVVHELRTLVATLYLAGVYDQLNLGSLSCLECVSRRIQTIVEAFSNSTGSTPAWSHARLYTGQATADDVVSPDLRSWAAKKGKEEVELHQARTKIREARRLGTRRVTQAMVVLARERFLVDVVGAVPQKRLRPRPEHEAIVAALSQNLPSSDPFPLPLLEVERPLCNWRGGRELELVNLGIGKSPIRDG